MIKTIIDFFSTNAVKQKIQNNSFSESHQFIYMYLILTIDAVQFTQEGLSVAGKILTITDLVVLWGYLLVMLIGLPILFVANGGWQGHDFIKKYFALSFTVGIKYAVIYFALSALPLSSSLEIVLFIVINILIITNIAYRLYEMRAYAIINYQTS